MLRFFNIRNAPTTDTILKGEDFRIGRHVGKCLFNTCGIVCMWKRGWRF